MTPIARPSMIPKDKDASGWLSRMTGRGLDLRSPSSWSQTERAWVKSRMRPYRSRASASGPLLHEGFFAGVPDGVTTSIAVKATDIIECIL